MQQIDFLRSVFPGDEQYSSVVIAGGTQRIRRGNFGVHLRLALLAKDIHSATTPREKARGVVAYLTAAGVKNADTASGLEAIAAYVELRSLNEMTGTLPFMSGSGGDFEPPPYDYPNRIWATWVHRIASRYHWTRDCIFSLSPEEVACYMQEIMVAEIDEVDFRRSLTEVSYKYDDTSKTSRFVPTPRPAWMVDGSQEREDEKEVTKISKSMLPVGNVVDLSGMGLVNGNDNH